MKSFVQIVNRKIVKNSFQYFRQKAIPQLRISVDVLTVPAECRNTAEDALTVRVV
jgi:hypothetical protein